MNAMRQGAVRPPRSGESRRSVAAWRTPAAPVPVHTPAAAPCACGGTCPQCRRRADALSISRPGDAGEVQARQIADRVGRGESVAGTVRPGGGAAGIARDGAGGGPSRLGGAVAQALQASRGGGQPLNPALGTALGRQFGTDFGAVRVHDDGVAAALSDRLQAKAFTVGRDVYFNRGRYQPQTPEGRHLLAHELTHVVQQEGQGGERVQRDVEEGSGEATQWPQQAEQAEQTDVDSGSGEAVEQKAGCNAERNFHLLIHNNYPNLEFTVPTGCTATVTFSALWVPIGPGVDCCTGADTYTLTRNGTPRSMPVGANICGDTDQHPRGVRQVTMRGGRQVLRIDVDRSNCDGISMDLDINVRIR